MDHRLVQRLEIDALRALCAIAETGGVTRAAEMLGLSQSAISHKIKRLETSLACALLTRRPNAPLFTEAGQDLLGYARRILALHDEALRGLSRTPLHGRIGLGMTEDTACSDLARILARFSRLYPQVSVRTRVRQSLALQEHLAAKEIDVAIMQVFAFEVRPSDAVLFKEGLHWVKSPDLELDPSRPIPFLSFDDQCFYRRWAMDVAQDGDTVFETVMECASAAGIATAVKSGLGVAVLNARHIEQEFEIMDGVFPTPPPVVYVARTAQKGRTEAVQSLIREIETDVGPRAALRIV